MSTPPLDAAPVTVGVLRTHGARATEAVVFEALAEHRTALRDPARLASALKRPLRVVVPSNSLRRHLSAQIARRWGASAGVLIQTHSLLAREILQRAGAAASQASGDLAFEVVVRRLARHEPRLARDLDFLVDGYGAVAATVRDLLDAGLEPVLADAIDEALVAVLDEDSGTYATHSEVERARALVRVAARASAEVQGHHALRAATLYARAAEHLASDPRRVLPASEVLIHGYADATGLVTDLLSALVRYAGARLFLDAPPDPAAPAMETDRSMRRDGQPQNEPQAPPLLPPRWQEAFSQRLGERLAGSAGEADAKPKDGNVPPPSIAFFDAPGSEAEAREVALRIRALLDGPGAPRAETIGIVARDLEPVGLALRGQLATLGVPFSGLDARGSLTAAGRRAQALQDLLRHRSDLTADRWLDATASLPREGPAGQHRHGGPFVDLRLAFYTVGAGNLRDVRDLDLDTLLGESHGLPLPVRKGFSYAEFDQDDDAGEIVVDDAAGVGVAPEASPPIRRTSFARRRHVPRGVVAGAVHTARGLLGRLDGWRGAGELAPAEHLRHLKDLLFRELGWRPEDAGGRPVLEALADLERQLPFSLALDYDEFRRVLSRQLEDAGRAPLGGSGGGVQVLSVVEARARTFSHLFVVGAHRGSFPRNVRPDPLLSDGLRSALAVMLPDVPRKGQGFDEERYLFAQLLSAAPRVTVSWQTHNDEGQPLAPSPLVERLLGPGSTVAGTVGHAPPLYSTRSPADHGAEPEARGPLPAREVAVVAALRGVSRQDFGELHTVAWEESRRAIAEALGPSAATTPAPDDSPTPTQRLAAARLRVLNEMAPDLRGEEGRSRADRLGPYLGFLGPVGGTEDGSNPDPRGAVPWVTHVENLAACPWQTFLRKVLRLEPTPDPLQALPGADPLLLGQVVHDILERVATESGAAANPTLDEALAGSPVPVRWPDPEELDRWLFASARRALLQDGVPLPGLARALADRAKPLVERAQVLEQSLDGESIGALGAEVAGAVSVLDLQGSPRSLRFIADRLDQLSGSGAGDGDLILTDYKTGRPLSDAKTEATRRKYHLADVARGQKLQTVAYRLAARAASSQSGNSPPVHGRYLYLKPDIEDLEAAVFAVSGGDEEMEAAFQEAVSTLLDTWDQGAFFPRVVDPVSEVEPTRCQYCEVSEACVRGDSGARLRMLRWNQERAGTATTAAEAAHHRTWWLAAPPDRRPAAEGGRVADVDAGSTGEPAFKPPTGSAS